MDSGALALRIDRALSEKWGALTRDKVRFQKVCGDFSREAIRAHPWEVARLSVTKCALAFAREEGPSRFVPENFWREQLKENEDRWPDNPRELELYYGCSWQEYDALAAAGAARTLPVQPWFDRFARFFSFTHDLHDFFPDRYAVRPTWLGLFALAGLVCAVWRWRELTILWLPLSLYLATVFAVGDRVDRYVQPVEWVGLVLAAVALDSLIEGILRGFRRRPTA